MPMIPARVRGVYSYEEIHTKEFSGDGVEVE